MNTSIRYDEKMLFFFGKKKHDEAENIATNLANFRSQRKALSTYRYRVVLLKKKLKHDSYRKSKFKK